MFNRNNKQPWSQDNARVGILELINKVSDEIESKLQRGDIKLPVFPLVATRVMAMASDEMADIGELADLIHKDQSLAGNVIKMANSPIFALDQPSSTLEEASCRLGMNMVSEIATVVAIKGDLFNVPAFKEQVEEVWKLSILSGYYSKEIAKILDCDPDVQFICGLLHTVGKPILFQMICDIGATQAFREGPYYALQDLVKRLHNFAGELAAKHWSLSPEVSASCRYYDCRHDTKKFRKEIGITYLAHRISRWCITQNSDLEKRILHDSVLEELGLLPDQIDSLLQMHQEILRKSTSVG